MQTLLEGGWTMKYSFEHCIYELDTLPGCTQIAISHGMFILPEHRGKGLNKVYLNKREEHAKSLGYDVILATVEAANIKEIKTLLNAGWYKHLIFNSKKTGNNVAMLSKILK